MSQWRFEASQRLPELQSTIASRSIRTPAELWMELRSRFDEFCHHDPAPKDLLSRIWQYAKWSLNHKDEAVKWAAINHFFEHIEDTRHYRAVLPTFMSRQEYEQFTNSSAPKKERS